MRSSLLVLVMALALFGTTPTFAAQGTTTTELPLRAAPASNTELLLTLPAGSSVTVGSCSGGWCRVTWKSYTGYTLKSGLVITTATRTRGPVRGGVTTPDGSELWPILPPYPYRSGYYPKADWYYDIPPYVAIEPSFYRRRYFMILQEHNRYRYVPHIFRGNTYKE
jgi:SH3 domain-containing protein